MPHRAPVQSAQPSAAHPTVSYWISRALLQSGVVVLIGAVLIAAVGCASAADGTAEAEEFATSGSAEADQRAEQVMAKEAQAEGADDDDTENKSKTLYARLGGEEGVKTIVDDAVDRVLVDPRVNVTRDGIGGGFFSSGPKTLEVNNSNTSEIKKHVAAFIALAAGGPAAYDGPEIRSAFAEREFSNIEFDAAVGCLQATLDKLAVADQEQRELLAIIETTREQVVEVR